MTGVPPSPVRQVGAEGLIDTRADWMEHAECRGADLRIFFVEKGVQPFQALAMCDRCIVRDDCLDYAQNNGEQHGIWGGKAPKSRIPGLKTNERYLSPSARKRIIFHHRSGWTAREIAKELGCPMRTVGRVLQAEGMS